MTTTTEDAADPIKVGDTIAHKLVPDFHMEVLAIEPCPPTPPLRDDPGHDSYQVIDPDGRTDWLCAHDVIKVGPR